VNDTSSRQPIDCPAPTLGHWPNFPPSTTIWFYTGQFVHVHFYQ
jgi:hypothetical protein